RAAGMTVAELDALLRGAGPREGDAAALEALRVGLRGLPRDGDPDATIVAHMAATLGVDAEQARTLVHDAVHTALAALREGEDGAAGALHKLRGAAWLVAKLHLEGDLAWLAKHGADLGILEFENLPDGAGGFDDAAQRFPAFERLLDTLRIRDSLPPGALAAIMGPALEDNSEDLDAARALCFQTLAQRAGWSAGEVEAVAAGLGFSFPRDFRDA